MVSPTRYGNLELDPVRRRILEFLPKSRTNLRRASLAIGRNPSYLYQTSPGNAPGQGRRALAAHPLCGSEEFLGGGARRSSRASLGERAYPAKA